MPRSAQAEFRMMAGGVGRVLRTVQTSGARRWEGPAPVGDEPRAWTAGASGDRRTWAWEGREYGGRP